MRGDVGCGYIDDEWVGIQRVEKGEEEAWKHQKGCGPGHDRRVIGKVKDHRGKRFIREEDR
eukprot:14933420-Heterocapsa_arctica.AAC.1